VTESKVVEKFSKLFDGEEACQADMELNADAKAQEVLNKEAKQVAV
jgi:hypothetical protein